MATIIKSNSTNTTQLTAFAAAQQSIRCTTVPKGYCVSFSYQPQRSIPIA